MTPERYRETAGILEATADVVASLNELLGMRRQRQAVVLLREVAKGSDAAFRMESVHQSLRGFLRGMFR